MAIGLTIAGASAKSSQGVLKKLKHKKILQNKGIMTSGTLYIVATPIGNLADFSHRAASVLSEVSLILAEDTRQTHKLLQHYGIVTKLKPYHQHNERKMAPSVINELMQGSSIALVSDAGTPGISDPGAYLVNLAHAAGIKVVPVAGPSALITALSASGTIESDFYFAGFLPSTAAQRQKRLAELKSLNVSLVFYEAPHRILNCLQDCVKIFGEGHSAVIARELTKQFETIKKAPLAELFAFVGSDGNQQKGELVVIVNAGHDNEAALHEKAQEIFALLCAEMSLKKAVQLTAKITGVNKNWLYEWAIKTK
jgi:16S rRNA (cytidine1402-2'-O)-methyltransferase